MHDNNRANTCQPGDIVCAVPSGSGIAVVAADTNTVDHNTVKLLPEGDRLGELPSDPADGRLCRRVGS